MKRLLSGVNPSFLGYYLARAIKEYPSLSHFFALFPDEEKAKDFVESFRLFSQEKAYFYPPHDLPPFSESITLDEGEKERLRIIWELPKSKVISLEIKGLLRRTLSNDTLKRSYLYFIRGEKINRDSLLEDLVLLGYERVGIVKSPGEFTVKGAVIDIFTPQEPYPIRIEFFGDEVVNLKYFDIESQKSISYLEELIILPARELYFPKDTGALYRKILSLKDRISERRISELIQSVENKVFFENPEFFLPFVHTDLRLLPENVPANKRGFLLFEKEAIYKKIEHFWDKLYLISKRAKERERLLYEETLLYATLEEVEELLAQSFSIEAYSLPFQRGDTQIFDVKLLEIDRKSRLEGAFSFLKEHLLEGYQVYLILGDEKNKIAILEGLTRRGLTDLENLKVYFGQLAEGFIYPREKILLTSDWELFGKRGVSREEKGGAKRAKNYFRRFEDLKPGDYVVHKQHGIGRFQGLVSLKVDGFEGEFLQIEYAGGDKLYLPVTRLNEIYPYVGLEEREPTLDKLGKKTFLQRRKEVEKRLAEVVEEILRLYAERKALKSYAIPFPALAYSEFAQTFPFEETPDQITAIEEILEDLTSTKAMERLLVGDVGFGKTEVALRAIFVTAYSGKQVAVLTPTTLLAEQHYRNFRERLEPFNIRVGILSRLRSPREQKETIKALSQGEIKVIVGTHRLLSKDVHFKDLGLLVIDEEHRFGVRHKEKLKQFKKTVKVLSLSATPIPRSLQLSLLGIFDLSLLETPPPGRKTIKTVLSPFDPLLIKSAIEEELSRKGQIYFVHPRIQGLGSLAQFLKKLVPQARIEILHGQMEEELLEKTIYQFLNGELDILVCTPIIGSGIDIPKANTIFINRADLFGLADIYQLRGRVGRGVERGYCYLLVPDLKTVTEGAQKRLKALMQFVELGSGFKLSLSDLKIRGAGELLGINQSGHINKVGYELYLELLENTIRSLKGEVIEDWEPEVNLKIPAYLPATYVPETEERLSLYRELVLINSLEELEDFTALLRDKYGPLPKEAENLLKIYKLKLYMKRFHLLSIEEKGKIWQIVLKDLHILPAFRKVSRLEGFQLFKVVEDKEKAYLYFRGTGSFLDFSLRLCQHLGP